MRSATRGFHREPAIVESVLDGASGPIQRVDCPRGQIHAHVRTGHSQWADAIWAPSPAGWVQLNRKAGIRALELEGRGSVAAAVR